ncbi:MAG: tRNA (adenosine(37)-N6)-threonylcarbamoyltransferase complex transferase subunit TsaD [Patescibacteria group bacterium]|nr:tRNA (adenosine(37)-N6)-threonylcarbamoyltransferase complex transferase subunit TsaD [Patescibacteria group bacterium]
MKILAIETSCDETSAAVLNLERGQFNLLSNIVSSQVKIHAKFGGVVPEVAARMQMEMILPVIDESLIAANIKLKNIDYLAVTYGPGLITSLTVGVETAKSLAFALKKTLIPTNHLAGHLLANFLPNKKITDIKFPALGLIVSGGHTLLVLMKNESNYKIIGETLDDAVGEAFDKVAKILNLGYPGGPIISKLANNGNSVAFNFPRPMLNSGDLNFSFSGLKTAVFYTLKHKNIKTLKQKEINDVCASFQVACVDVLTIKTLRALQIHQPNSFLLGGGVAANPTLRQRLQEQINKNFPKIKIFIPELRFTGDNAGMIAAAGYFQVKKSKFANFKKLKANPNLSL